MLDALPQGKDLHTIEFVSLVRGASETERRTPIIAMDAYKVTEPSNFLIKKSFGKYSHHFIVVEIATEPCLFARVDFQGDLPFNAYSVAHSVILSLDRAALTPASASFARFSNGSPGGPTLAAFASLLDIMHRRTPHYDVFSRNCLWFVECILYATGRRYADHWRTDYIAPAGLERYIHGSIGATRATAEICVEDETARFCIDASLQVLKGMQWFFSLPGGSNRIKYPDEEIGEILNEWRDMKEF
ncbi:hypothetical protein C8R43DRAFT_1169416 [Mycena crocata]|nr:hypothetical protein C8R43DRAFT_1169416 [Mycena crocata]